MNHSAPERPVSATEQVRKKALELGFQAVGFARADVPLERDIVHYDRFVAEGMHGEMAWLARHRRARERLDTDAILAGAKSVICVARSYQPSEALEPSLSPTTAGIARYARGRDYHKFLRRRIRRLAAFVRTLGSPDGQVRARPICDDAPVLERAWAARAGLGFIGKNGMLIVPGLGSMVLLGEVVTTLELVPAEAPLSERCGSCSRCLDACPTSAFVAPFVLDPRRCVSYLTIEAESTAAPELLEAAGTHLFGCDDCQTVCPFNARARTASAGTEDGGPFAPLARWSGVRLEDLLVVSESEWRTLSEGSPLRRAGRAGLARNAAVVLGNRADESALATLRGAAANDPDEGVRDAAAWAISRLERSKQRG